MRLAQLSLVQYGKFAGCDLHFPQALCDFHLIYGPNEAGKSTTLAAVSDLLFGFPTRTAYSFKYDNALLRVGAVLEHGGVTLTLRRRKGNRDTLHDLDGNPVPDAVLAPMLRGLTAETFRLSSSLDHVRLREGGQAILDAKDDIGQALFAAGSGIVEAQELLRDLETEADGIWATRRAAKRSYWKFDEEHTDALRRLKAVEVRPKEWTDAQAAQATTQAAQARLEAERGAVEASLRRVQRIRRLAGTVRQRAALLEASQGLAASPFDAASEAAFQTAIDTIRQAQTDAALAQADAAEFERRRDLIEPDAAILAHFTAIETTTHLAGAAAKAADDLPALQFRLAGHLDRVASFRRDLAWPDADLPDLMARMPSRLVLNEVRQRLAERQTLETERAAVQDAILSNDTLRQQLEAALAGHRDPGAADMLARTVRAGQRAAELDARLPSLQRAAAAAARDFATARSALAPWQGDATALADLSPPALSDIAHAEDLFRRAGDDLEKAAGDLADGAEELRRLNLERCQLLEDRGAIALEQVQAARADRDQALTRLRAHLRAEHPTPGTALDAIETTIHAADQLADERYAKAEASARLSDLRHHLARTALAHDHAELRQQAANQALTAATTAWHQTLATQRLPPMTPSRALSWRAEHAETLRAASRAAEAALAFAHDEAKVREATTALQAALLATGAPPLSPDTPFARTLSEAEAHAARLSQAATQRTKLETRLQTALAALAESRRRLSQLEMDEARWLPTWSDLASQSSLSGTAWDATGARLSLIEDLRVELAEALDVQRRVTGIESLLRDFDRTIRQLATECRLATQDQPPHRLANTLRDQLTTAQSDLRARQELRQSLDVRHEAIRVADHTSAIARAQLAPLIGTAVTDDLPALSAALDRFSFQRRTWHDIAELERKLLAEGDGFELAAILAEATGADPDELAAQDATLSARQADLNAQIASKAEDAGVARKTIEALDHGAQASLAAADVEQARAAMATEAEAYLIKRAQAVMLRWAVDRYRDRRQSPMLARASQHFATLTLGRYAELRIDLEGDQPRLIGVHAVGGTAVSVDGMSDGTIDQLFLALRLAALEQSVANGAVVPFLADDLFINFDDERAFAGFKVLGEIARRTQVLFFTHHSHLRAIANEALHPHILTACELT